MVKVGILSDTHGLLRPEVKGKLAGCERILHAGDVGRQRVLDELAEIAPVEAVRGNTDTHAEVSGLPFLLAGEIDGLPFHMVHQRQDVDPAWRRRSKLIIFGHSHRPELEWQGGCLLLNPGAVGARRFQLPLTLAIVTIHEGRLMPEILSIES